MCIFSISLGQKQPFSSSLRSDPRLSWAALLESSASATSPREQPCKLGSVMGMTRKANPAVGHKTAQASLTEHFSKWPVRQVTLHHLEDSSQQRNISVFLVDHWKLLLKLSAVNMVSPCCTFCPLPFKKDFSDSFSCTNFPKRIPTGKLLDCVTRHSRWQAESFNRELLHTLRRVKRYWMASFQKQSTSLPEIR